MNKLKIAHGARIIVEKHVDNALSRLVPPTSDIKTLDNDVWLKPMFKNKAATSKSTPALWSETSKNDMTK